MSLVEKVQSDADEAINLLQTIKEYPVKASHPHVHKLRGVVNRLEDSLLQHTEHAETTGGETPANS